MDKDSVSNAVNNYSTKSIIVRGTQFCNVVFCSDANKEENACLSAREVGCKIKPLCRKKHLLQREKGVQPGASVLCSEPGLLLSLHVLGTSR